MSTQSIYRALLKSAKRYDSSGWRRSLLLNSLSKVSPITSSIGNTEKSGRALFFLAQNSDDAQYMVRHAFRQPLEGSTSEAVNRGFEVLRTLNAADANTVATTSYASFSPSSSIASVSHSSIQSTTSTTHTSNASSSTKSVQFAAPRSQPVTQVLRMPLGSSTSSSSSSRNVVESGGPAIRQMPRPAKDYGAHTSILGRLHSESMDLQKPRTPPPRMTHTEEHPVDRNRDSGYEGALFQMRIVASEYLKQLNSVSAHDPAACNGQADATSASPASASAAMSLHLIERSRMKAQHKQWESEVRKLNVHQQLQLEEAVNSLGQSVVANNLRSVLQFQSELSSSSSAEIRLALLSNNQVLDAWIDFLHSNNQFDSIIQLFRTRLANDVCTDEFSLSRKSLCKVLMSCAVEGDAETSLMALRESSWSALAHENSEVLKSQEFNYGDLTYPTSTPAAPTSVNRQPSWVPPGAYFQNSLAQPRANLESEEQPDTMLAAAGEDFGSHVDSVAAASASTILAPAPNPRVHLSVNVNARSISTHYLRLSTLINPPSPQSSSHASMSTCARAPSRPPTPPQLQEQPPTPVPIIDHWTELSLDSRLIEMAIVAAVRAQARKKEFEARDAEETIKAQAAANQLHPDAEINYSIHQHAAAMARQQEQAKKQAQEWSEVIEEEKPMTVFEALNSNESPLAFQLWSLMLQQRVPLQHSNSFVQLMNNLESNTDSLSKSTANLFLQTLSHELHHARKSDSFRFKYLRADVEKFLGMELDLNQHLAVDENGADNVWQCLSVLRTMQQEQFTPPVAALNSLFQNMLFFSENGYGRSKLIQDLLCIVDDFSAVDPNISVDAVLNCLENPTQPQ